MSPKGHHMLTDNSNNHNAVINFCANTGDRLLFYFKHQYWESISVCLQQASAVSTLIVRKTICTSVSVWIMGKHVITSLRRLGRHPALVFRLIPQMPSAWHLCEEAGTPSRFHCWNPPHGAEQAQSCFFPPTGSYLVFPLLHLYQWIPPRCPSPCLLRDWRPPMINHSWDTLVH